MASSFLRFPNHTQRRITVSRTPLDEWSVRRRDLYLKIHNTHNRQTDMPTAGFEPTISAVDLRLRSHGQWDRRYLTNSLDNNNCIYIAFSVQWLIVSPIIQCVERGKVVSLQAMQVIKGDQNVYPMPGGLAGQASPGGYKYGWLALQVWGGGGATVRQPVTAKKRTVRKHNLWPRYSQTAWNRPTQTTRTWDERRGQQLGKWNCVETDTNKCKCTNWKKRWKNRADRQNSFKKAKVCIGL